jgi:hypothetical protein
MIPRPTYRLMLSSTSRPIRILDNSCMSLQLVEREYKGLGGVCRIGRAGLTHWAWQETQTDMVQSTNVLVYASVNGVRATRRMLSLHARTEVGRLCIPWGYSRGTVIQRMALCMSTAIIRVVEKRFSLIFGVMRILGPRWS